MTHQVAFSESLRYELAAAIAVPLSATVDAANLSVSATEPLINLLQLLASGAVAVFPVRRTDHDDWIIAGATRRDLDVALTRVSRFIVPTYAEYEGGVPTHHQFDQTDEPIGHLGHALYPAGYYVLRALRTDFDRVLGRLGRWANLEAARPQLIAPRAANYRDLYDEFSAALSAGVWELAENRLAEIRRRGLATADNLAFLEVQLLAQQRRWLDLWQREDYRDIARLRMPRAVRDALLAAFHQSELLLLEQSGDWSGALDRYRRTRGRLGRLIEGEPDTTYGPALRVLAYQAIAAGNRAAAEALATRATDAETRTALTAIAELLPPTTPAAPPAQVTVTQPVSPQLTARQALRLAIADDDLAAAMRHAERMEESTERASAVLEVAFLSGEVAHAESALLEFWSLPQTEQEMLLQSRKLAQMVAALGDSIAPEPVTPTSLEAAPITDWLEWLAIAATNPDDRRLSHSLQLIVRTDGAYWNEAHVTVLAERLTDLATGGDLGRSHLREAVRRLRDTFIQDPEFPRDDNAYIDVYEALYLAMLEQREVNQVNTLALLRLAEARLRQTPSARAAVTEHLRSWLREPTPVLGDTMLEALDLLAAYGEQGPTLGPWLRVWAEAILSSPRSLERAVLEGWQLFAEWAQPGDDLLEQLRERITAFNTSEDDSIALLPSGYTIGIFTLRPESAARVGEIIQRRNPNVEVRLCADRVLTQQARSLAQNADMCVVVTTCITHALTYGIGPYLADPVYPQSSGSTSILQAIEGRARSVSIG